MLRAQLHGAQQELGLLHQQLPQVQWQNTPPPPEQGNWAESSLKIEGVYNDATKQKSLIGTRVEIECGPQVSMSYLNPKSLTLDEVCAACNLTCVIFD